MNNTSSPPSEARPKARPPSDPERAGGPGQRAFRPGGVRLGRWFGIDVRLEGSWFVIFALLTVAFSGNLAAEHPTLIPEVRWSVALATSLVFFGSILLHELAHSVVARRRGLRVHGITLMAFGGVSHLASEPKRAKDDLAIALVGPLTSAALGALFLAAAWLISTVPLARSVTSWLGFINLGLAGFNLLPGYPLDGGRVLKALVWSVTGDAARAYRSAVTSGKAVAYGLILAGVYLAFGLQWTYDGLWIGFMGWYLLSGAQASHLWLTVGETLRGHQVRDVLRPPVAVVSGDLSLAEAVDAWVLRRGHRVLFVCEGTRLLGLLTLHEVKQVPPEQRNARTVAQVMIPAARLSIAGPEENLLQAFQRMSESAVNQLPVVSSGELIGVVSREDVVRVLAIHRELSPG